MAVIRPPCHCECHGTRDKPFSHSLSLRSRVNGCGNPFLFLKEADSFVLRTQNDKSFSCHEYRVVCAISCRLVIAVRVSGGHLCEAEAPTEPAGETAARCVAIRFSPSSSLRVTLRAPAVQDRASKRKRRGQKLFALQANNNFWAPQE